MLKGGGWNLWGDPIKYVRLAMCWPSGKCRLLMCVFIFIFNEDNVQMRWALMPTCLHVDCLIPKFIFGFHLQFCPLAQKGISFDVNFFQKQNAGFCPITRNMIT